MAVIGKDSKQPNEVLDWDVSFADWMRPGDEIDIVQVDIRRLAGPDTDPLTVDQVQNTTHVSKVWLRGGADGARYRVQLRADTIHGRVKEAEFDISVKEV